PTVLVVAFIRFIDSFRVFDNVYVLTGSGAGGNTTTVSIYIYLAFFKQDDIGLAVAASIVLLVLSFLVLAGVLRLTERRP
ncbi:MAG: sugar ABC transporter permease, partial [Methylobacteriaceae bacterium]|nr:sugar ABC transporter permease [Methylobacteriaceae bacterium]